MMMLSARISEHYTVEELKAKMEELGYKWRDFAPDPMGTRYRGWYYRNRRKFEIVPIFHFDNPSLIFYAEKDATDQSDHPLKGKGRFKAIYIHEQYYLCPVTLVWAEMVNSWARIEYIDGEPLKGAARTSPTRLLLYHPYTYHLLRTMSVKHAHYYEAWSGVLEGNRVSDMIQNESEVTVTA